MRFETVLWETIDARLRAAAQVTLATVNLLLVIQSQPACRVQDIAMALEITVGGTSQAALAGADADRGSHTWGAYLAQRGAAPSGVAPRDIRTVRGRAAG